MKRVLGFVALLAALVLAVVHWLLLQEAYGDGPPYYGRSVNMDKWSNPWPMLVVLDLIAVVALAVVWRSVKRRGS